MVGSYDPDASTRVRPSGDLQAPRPRDLAGSLATTATLAAPVSPEPQAQGPSAEVLRQPVVIKAYLGDDHA